MRLLRSMQKYKRELIVCTTIVVSGIFLAKDPVLGLYGVVKLIEFIFLGWYIGVRFPKIKLWKIAGSACAIGMVFESILAFLQYEMQASINGWLYFFGERFFTSATPGIAHASLNGHLLLRPYGTLPHPNVLAGYMLVGILVLLGTFPYYKHHIIRLFFGTAIILGAVTVLFTFSRVAIVLLTCLCLAGLLHLSRKKKKSWVTFFFVVSCIAVFLFSWIFVENRFSALTLQDETITDRVQGIRTALFLLQKNVFFGSGIQNYIPAAAILSTYAVSLYGSLQPVHNMYLLIVSELGVMGAGIVAFFVYRLLHRLLKAPRRQRNILFAMILVIGVIGMFDHYFWTLQSGRMLLALVLGITYASSRSV